MEKLSDTVALMDPALHGLESAAIAVKKITALCDARETGETEAVQNRNAFGKIESIFTILVDIMASSKANPSLRAMACKCLGLLCFNNMSNSLSATKVPALGRVLTKMMAKGSPEEQEWAAGTIANICVNDGNDTARLTLAKNEGIIRELKRMCLSLDGTIKLRAVGAINNLSRSREAVPILDKGGVVDLALSHIIRSEGSGDQHDVLVARAMMAAANVIGREENNTLITENPGRLKTIVKCFDKSQNEGSAKDWAGVYWTVPLVLFPLFNLSVADANKPVLVQAGLMNALFRLIGEFDVEHASDVDRGIGMVELGLHTIYNMVFDPSAKQWIEENNGVAILKKLADLNPERSFRAKISAKEIIGNIFWELGLDATGKPRAATQTKRHELGRSNAENFSGRKWVMISYNWSHQGVVKGIADRLIETGIPVWMDILPGCMEGHTLEAMAEAVDNASVVVTFVTRQYKESANCRRECSYAQDLHKPIVPVILEEGYEMDGSWGWLGLILAGKKWIDFSDEASTDIKMSELIGEIAASAQDAGAVAKSTDKKLEDLPDAVQEWMCREGFEEHVNLFAKHEIRSLNIIRKLSEHDLYRLGLPIGHRIKLAMLIDTKLKPLQGCDEDMEAVRKWLDKMKLERYYDVFSFQKLSNLKLIARLSVVDLDHMLSPIGHRVVIREQVAALAKQLNVKGKRNTFKYESRKSYFSTLFNKE